MSNKNNSLFSLEKKRFSVKKSDLIKDLEAFKKIVGDQKVSAKDYNNWKDARFSKDSFTRQFGSWSEACNAVGLSPKKIHQYSTEDLLVHLEKVWRWRDQRPTISDLQEYNQQFDTSVTHDTYVRRWGDWKTVTKIFSEYMLGQKTVQELKVLEAERKKKSKRVGISARLRSQILERDNYTCIDCGASPRDDDAVTLEVHHLKPVSKGGKTEIQNLVTNCVKCNRGKGNLIVGNSNWAEKSIEKYIQLGESDLVEWKATSRYSLRSKEHDKELYYPIIKAVCALANNKGGTVIVGYDETTSSYVGINDDGFGTDTDKWENWIRQKLDHHTKQSAAWINGIDFSYQTIEHALCVKIEVTKQKDPIVCSGIGKTSSRNFTYVRSGAYTRTLDNPKDIIDHFSNR